ncbi:MAG TPA: 6-bladed beta-propeller [Lacipirellulaceae bacterium]|nr:6-bladed beta-propeller [Lacipirellulaceae bacterium]
MKFCWMYLAAAVALFPSIPARAQQEAKPVRMGCGIMTFDTVPGWGLLPDGQSALGPTHGGVAIDKEGSVYVSADKGVVVFSPEGKVTNSFLGDKFSQIHDLKIRDEDGTEFVYAARNNAAEGIKFNAHTGEIVLHLPFPKESGLDLKQFHPTAITVGPNGNIYLADGYASNYIFIFDKDGKYLKHFGSAGNDLKQFNTCHGMALDTRYDPPRLLICDRNHQPKGRLLHYDLDGNFIEEVVTGLGMPTSVAIQGDYVSVPDLHGRLVILDKSNTIMAVLGHNANPKMKMNFKVPQEKWIEGVFNAAHGSAWDKDGNLYVQDWNTAGRIMKLVRVKGIQSL